MSMPNLHTARKLFMHEKTRLRAGATDRFLDGFGSVYQVCMEKAGARLYGIWESSPLNAKWPEITTIWSVDDYKHVTQIADTRHRNVESRKPFLQWQKLLGELDAHGEGRIVFGNSGIKSVEEHKAAGLTTTVVLEEVMQTKPNGQTKYVEELEYLYVPWSQDTGKSWVGSFTTVFRYNEVIHYWAMEKGWDVFANHYPSWTNPPDPRIRAWTNVASALRDGWEDSFLQALPPNPLG